MISKVRGNIGLLQNVLAWPFIKLKISPNVISVIGLILALIGVYFVSQQNPSECLKSANHEKSALSKALPTIEFDNIEVTPNEHKSSEMSVKNVGRFDIFLTADYRNNNISGKINIIFELKIDSSVDAKQSQKYADWLLQKHPTLWLLSLHPDY